MTVAAAIYGIAIGLFLDPNRLAPGGVAGTAVILNRLLPLATGTLILIMNVPIFLFGLWKMHRKQKPLMVRSYGMAGILMATAIGIGGMFDAGMDHVGVARMYWLIMGTLFAGANIMSGKNTLGQSKL